MDKFSVLAIEESRDVFKTIKMINCDIPTIWVRARPFPLYRGVWTEIYLPISDNHGKLYIHNDQVGRQSIVAVNVFFNHEMKLCVWGLGVAMQYPISKMKYVRFRRPPQHDIPDIPDIPNIANIPNILRELFEDFKVVPFSDKLVANMKRFSGKRARQLGPLGIHRDIQEKLVDMMVPAWVLALPDGMDSDDIMAGMDLFTMWWQFEAMNGWYGRWTHWYIGWKDRKDQSQS